jgi:hypothetical protein
MRRLLFLSFLAFAIAAGAGCHRDGGADSGHASEGAHLRELSVDDVDKRIAANDGHFFVFDANPKDVYASGHVPGAKWVPYDGVTADMLPADKKASLVFYCANEH